MEIGIGVGVEAEGVGQQVGGQDVAQHSVERGGRLRRGRGGARPAPAAANRQARKDFFIITYFLLKFAVLIFYLLNSNLYSSCHLY